MTPMTNNALVVGAAGGVGTSVVQQLIERGYQVVGTVMDHAQCAHLKKVAPGVAGLKVVDLSNADTLAGALSELVADHAPLNAVAVCAGVSPYGPLETTPLSQLRLTYEINTIAGLAVYQFAMPHLRRTRGRMAMISSTAGRVAFPMLGHYSSSKFALEALCDVMRREAAQWGVDVILIEPGGIKTSMVTNLQAQIQRDIANLRPDVQALYGDQYASFERAARGGYDSATPPERVAEVMVNALVGPGARETRYPVGPDGVYLCQISRTMTDRELDQLAKIETANSQLNEAAASH